MDTYGKERKQSDSPDWRNPDLLVKAKLPRSDIQLLAKYVEGLGHLGVITTTNKILGEVLIQTTTHCWPDLKKNLLSLPLDLEIIDPY
ncbi:DUF4911 domain-containing protein [Dehalobacter sp. DCM]|uniref:DUF4911 domain-containing protein n=1 Tax=Dehalobacter sp. DCM TaxID=2907827 RepID=UPI003081D01C|nr:DUF4911 domain-containing protein [Dehalobacter sp. DCM]